MTILTQAPTCCDCGRRLNLSDRIEWVKGEKRYHDTCLAHRKNKIKKTKTP